MTGQYRLVVIGASAGGLDVCLSLLSDLSADFQFPIILAQHVCPNSKSHLAEILSNTTTLSVKDAEDKMPINSGCVYISPPGYHTQVEFNHTISLSADDPVNFSKPSIDVLFNSAAEIYQQSLIGVLLTGANSDGAKGLLSIQEHGGLVMTQDPTTALSPIMPVSGIKLTQTKNVYSPSRISLELNKLSIRN